MIGEEQDDEMMSPAAKRVGPEDVPSVTLGRTRFEVIHWGRERGLGQSGGYIAAFDAATNKERWTLKVYDLAYDPDLEEDVQDVFIEGLAPRGEDKLAVLDERGRRYIVDPRQRSVRPE
ncbi:MAG TPA: hypothetical protein VH374_00730 [Polyangia bacterium]|jgi:hypothetical protein|nr:hypothetical protein [Polyangia bacterium]